VRNDRLLRAARVAAALSVGVAALGAAASTHPTDAGHRAFADALWAASGFAE